MRVSSGKYRSIRLETIESNDTRPTLAKVKEAIFSMLVNKVYDSNVLDLFAGSGALGIEALSNGAKWVDFNDNSYKVGLILKKNLSKIDSDNYNISKLNYSVFFKKATKQYDLIFLDPPYHLQIIEELLTKIIEYSLITNNGIIVCEYDIDENIDFLKFKKLEVYKDKKYGKTKITMLRRID